MCITCLLLAIGWFYIADTILEESSNTSFMDSRSLPHSRERKIAFFINTSGVVYWN